SPPPANPSLRYGTSWRRWSKSPVSSIRSPPRIPTPTRAAGPRYSLSKAHLRKRAAATRITTIPTQVAHRAPIRCSSPRDGRAGANGGSGGAAYEENPAGGGGASTTTGSPRGSGGGGGGGGAGGRAAERRL